MVECFQTNTECGINGIDVYDAIFKLVEGKRHRTLQEL